MYQLYIANKNYSSWSLRPWVLMRESGIPFEERLVPFDASGNHGFERFTPSGKVPCLVDGDITVWDSLSITEYLAERHAGIWPDNPVARAWARSAAAEMHSGFFALRERCTMNVGLRVQLHQIPPALQRDIGRIDQLWQDGLSRFGGPFLAGSAFGAVDAFYAPVAFRVQTYGLELSPQAKQYADRLIALPSMQDWTKSALAEPWRDPDHEEDAKRVGTWLADLRK